MKFENNVSKNTDFLIFLSKFEFPQNMQIFCKNLPAEAKPQREEKIKGEIKKQVVLDY